MPVRAIALPLRRFGATAAMTLCLIAPAQADETIRIGTPESSGFSFSVPDVGTASGIFGKHGLAVERIDFAGGAKMHQAMGAGALDVVSGTGSDSFS